MTLKLDYALAMRAGVGPAGLEDADLERIEPDFARGLARLSQRAGAGELGFYALPSDGDALAEVERVRAALPGEVRDVLALGIGGSSLGARALRDALCPPAELFDGPVRLHLPDNSDPWLLSHLLATLDPKTTAVLVSSKSGGTVETAAHMLIVHEWMQRALGDKDTARRFVAITDPRDGSLRKLASQTGWHTLPIPKNVGGRFSVLTAVGLLPARLLGIDAEALLEGAAAMAKRAQSASLHENPAALIAALHVLHAREKGHCIHVMMPYADRLRAFGDWYVQLWAESLGKRLDRDQNQVESGPTPLRAVGATDQHAQVQLFIEGPRDKLLTFIGIEQLERDLTIPASPGDNAYLGGHSLGELLDAERRGTTEALASDGRPSITLTLPRLDAFALGELFFLYEAATAFAGELYGIDAFNQPGVELGKRIAFGLLGRSGYQQAAADVEAQQAKRPARYRA